MEWSRIHDNEFYDTHCSPNIIQVFKSRRMKWDGHTVSMRERRGTYRVLVGKPKGKRPRGRPKRLWEHNIKIVFYVHNSMHLNYIYI
jgi:hypothetical protein